MEGRRTTGKAFSIDYGKHERSHFNSQAFSNATIRNLAECLVELFEMKFL